MALYKCRECGHEISDQAKYCPKCGKEFKQQHRSKKFGFGICLCIVGVLSIILALNIHYRGISEYDRTYGGDAYTGIQNSIVTVANNVEDLGNTLVSGMQIFITIVGSVLILTGGYFIMTRDK